MFRFRCRSSYRDGIVSNLSDDKDNADRWIRADLSRAHLLVIQLN